MKTLGMILTLVACKQIFGCSPQLDRPGYIRVMEGESFTVTCNASCSTSWPVIIVWFRPDQTQVSANGTRRMYTRRNIYERTSSLVVTRAQRDDAGVYRCLADVDYEIKEVNVRVTVDECRPHIMHSNGAMQVQAGNFLKVVCNVSCADGFPGAMRWYRPDMSQILGNTREQVHTVYHMSRRSIDLVFRSPALSESGVYTCIVDLKFDYETIDVDLNIFEIRSGYDIAVDNADRGDTPIGSDRNRMHNVSRRNVESSNHIEEGDRVPRYTDASGDSSGSGELGSTDDVDFVTVVDDVVTMPDYDSTKYILNICEREVQFWWYAFIAATVLAFILVVTVLTICCHRICKQNNSYDMTSQSADQNGQTQKDRVIHELELNHIKAMSMPTTHVTNSHATKQDRGQHIAAPERSNCHLEMATVDLDESSDANVVTALSKESENHSNARKGEPTETEKCSRNEKGSVSSFLIGRSSKKSLEYQRSVEQGK